MPNSKPENTEPTLVQEIIPTNDSQQENRFFFLTLFLVLWLAAYLLWLTTDHHKQTVRLPSHLTNLATQLSIASDEIAMLQDIELLSEETTLEQLQEQELSPFTTEAVVMAGVNCFVIDKEQISLRLLKLPEHSWQVQWRDNSVDHHGHHGEASAQTQTCVNDDSWLAASNLVN